jgi:hypothetical protein
VPVDNAEALDQTIRGAGWNWFLMATELRIKVFGSASQMVLRRALMLIVKKQPTQFFNCLEVTSISTKNSFGLPYTVVTANSRHISQVGDWMMSIAAEKISGKLNGRVVD